VRDSSLKLLKNGRNGPFPVDRRRHEALSDIPAGTNYYDSHYDTMIHKINEGGFCVLSRSSHIIMTTLGSCISVCMHDPQTRVGGMNHFLLPEFRAGGSGNNLSMRYGINAMETLFNEVIKRGGKKSRLVVKAFGAGKVINISSDIGARNQLFLKQYIADEGLKLAREDLGGNFPRSVIFYPSSGKAFVRILRRASDVRIGEQEERFRKKISDEFSASDIKLF